MAILSLPFQGEGRAEPKETDGAAATTDHTDSTPTVSSLLTVVIGSWKLCVVQPVGIHFSSMTKRLRSDSGYVYHTPSLVA